MTSPSCKPDIVPEFTSLTKCLQPELEKDATDTKVGKEERYMACVEDATDVRAALRRKHNIVGEGVHRVVLDISPQCVMKVAKSLDGARANLAETNAWKQIKATRNKKIVELFAPISSAGEFGEYIVMPKVETLDVDAPTTLQSYYQESGDWLHMQLEKLGVRCRDLHDGNIGKIKGRWVVIDYGFGIKCELPKRVQRPRGWMR